MVETMEYRVEQLEKRVADNEEKNTAAHKEFHRHHAEHLQFESQFEERCKYRHSDLEELKKDNVDFKIFIAQTNTNYSNLNLMLQSVAADVKALREKPGKRWESIVGTVIAVVVAAVVSFAIGRIGLA